MEIIARRWQFFGDMPHAANRAAVAPPDAASVRDAFESAGQGHVFRFWDKLNAEQRAELLGQAAAVDLAELARLVETLVLGAPVPVVDFSSLRPAPVERLPAQGGDAAQWTEARARGEDALRTGRVAAFTVAGGQGTRLGFDGPKGTFGVTPVRGHSLFQVFAEKILAAGARHGRTPPWFILTSPANHAATAEFFQREKFFGLDPTRVRLLPQGTMPAVDFSGKLLLDAPHRLALSPDGHGGALRALARVGATEEMRKLDVDTISYFQVDNPLVRFLDPAFIGFHLAARSEMSSKTIPKREPREKVGCFCLDAAGRLVVIEYSDLPAALAGARAADGSLIFGAGSIAIHVLDREFVARIGDGRDASCRLPFHRADKKIACVDDSGRAVQPDKPNGVKFEMFVFDALPFARNPVVVETERSGDFSPVKNAEGEDSPATARADQLRLFAKWLRAAGADLPVDAAGLPPFPIEISPRFGDDAESVAARWRALEPKPALVSGLVLE